MGDIFTIWLTDGDWKPMPYIYEICIASWQVFNPNRKVIIYTNHELHLSFLDRKITEIRKLQDFYPEEYEFARKMTKNKAHQSDYIRYSILKDTQSIYLDTDVLCYASLDELWTDFQSSELGMTMCWEDNTTICNAMLMSGEGDKYDVLNDILENYRNNYISHSYTFNSQKYLQLMARRYRNEILHLGPSESIFKPNWSATQEELILLLQDHEVADTKSAKLDKYDGIGFHLYGSLDNWKWLREYIDAHMYDNYNKRYITQLTKFVIDSYIKLMKEADNNEK